jgi:thiosulfate/3-mercaptopyruvate sulfurtransferase
VTDWLVSTQWLAAHLADPDIVILDCSWYLPETGKHAIDDFRRGHIPGARFIDLGVVSDPDSPYVNMLPNAERWAGEVGRLGIGNDTMVVVYDAGYVSARLWWMFRTFGHDSARILDGGWRKWKAEGRAIETGDGAAVEPVRFDANLREGRIAQTADVLEALASGSATVVDARTAARFDGTEGSGYPGVASGHMPGAINTPWARFFDAERNYVFVGEDAAMRVFAEAGADIAGPVVTTCGSGVTAAILGFMIERSGNHDWKLYDGSWHEWAQCSDTPKQTKAKDS